MEHTQSSSSTMTEGKGGSGGQKAGEQNARRDSNITERPSIISRHSTSLPPSPRQHARDLHRRSRTPSPSLPKFARSPRSAMSESSRSMLALRPTKATCRFQSTQTSRRRIPYSIGTDVLERDPEASRRRMGREEENKLSESMEQLYNRLLPSPESERSRLRVAEKIRQILREEWPDQHAEVVIFGSSGNLLFTNASDVDICIVARGIDNVCALAELLARRGMRKVTCVHAKSVPIVKIWDPEFEVACDLNVNNLVALRNTDMVKAYMEVDRRVRPLAMIVKYWTSQRIINEASGGTLSSYTWTLLLINFLQTRWTPILPVFPVTDDYYQPKSSFAGDLQRTRGYGKPNEEPIARLLFDFFKYYGHEIDYESAVVSVRRGILLTKEEKNWHITNNNRLCVEEPFNTTRNLANTADDTAFRGLHLELRRAFDMIAEAKDLISEVCEQYEYPAEGPRAIFESAQPQPRPILSRSTSQSSRSNRGGTRGNRRGQETRNGPSGRRSSSAAAFGHTAVPGVQGLPTDVPMSEYFRQQQRQANSLSSEELTRLSRQISAEQHTLRLKQAQNQLAMQAQLQQTYAIPAIATSTLPRSSRNMHSAYPSDRIMSLDIAPAGSAPLYPPYPFGPQFESPITTSYSSSQQGTSTNPNSPLLTPATPYRRGLQRAPQSSSSTDPVRSHSQPARPLAPPLSASAARHQYGSMGMPQMLPNAPHSAYMGPYMGPYGSYYVPMPTADALPRDYLGYGIGGEPQSASASQSQTPAQMPVNDDALFEAQYLLPLQRASSISSTVPDPPRSPSPLAMSSDYAENQLSAPMNSGFPRHRQGSGSRYLPVQDSAPIVVNGSSVAKGKGRSTDNKTGLEDRRVSDPTSGYRLGPESSTTSKDLQRSPQSFASRVSTSLAQQEQRRQVFQRPNFLNAEELDEPIAIVTGSMASMQLPSKQDPKLSPQPALPSGKQRSPVEAHPTPPEVRRNTNSIPFRAGIPPLDLGTSSTTPDPAIEVRPTGAFLSPVQETRTPSPTSHRKQSQSQGHSKTSSLQWAAFNGSSKSTTPQLDTSSPQLMPPPPPSRKHASSNSTTSAITSDNNTRNGFNPTSTVNGTTPTSSNTTAPKRPAPIQTNSAGSVGSAKTQTPSSQTPSLQTASLAWQQAGKKGKGKSKKENDASASASGGERKGGGQVMPENVAERKGG